MIEARKLDHLGICIKKGVEYGDTGFSRYALEYRALPELDYKSLDTSMKFLGRKLAFPLIIEGMTGGAQEAKKINRDLASVAQEYGIGFGVGSQRAALEDPKLEDTYRVREVAPDILLIGNLGAVQLNYGHGVKECRRAVGMIDADALALHVNPVQELIQPEGDTNFRDLIRRVNQVRKKLRKPVVVKGVGLGIDYGTARKLRVDAIDVGGLGGTSWTLIEGYRNKKKKKLSESLAGLGISTAENIRLLSKIKTPLIASGGIRSGLDAAKAIALGASCVGVALPVLKALNAKGKKGVREYLNQLVLEFKAAMFLTGSRKVKDLAGRIREE